MSRRPFGPTGDAVRLAMTRTFREADSATIARHVGCSVTQARAALHRLVVRGVLRRVRDGVYEAVPR